MEQQELGTTDSVAHTLKMLEHIEENPDITQADLAARVGIAIGTANWYLKRLTAKGFVKVKQLQRRRLRYLITPQGIAERTRLAMSYLEVSMRLYRETRSEAQQLLTQVRQAGYGQVYLLGNGDLADVCRLTCLEQGLHIQDGSLDGHLPILAVNGTGLTLTWPGDGNGSQIYRQELIPVVTEDLPEDSITGPTPSKVQDTIVTAENAE